MHLSRIQLLWAFIAFVALIRLVTLALYPLMDTTEARYGEIARIMVETGNWITPQIDYDKPFWGKPPLYAWVSGLSILVLGNSEFALRLPHLVAAIVILILLWKFAIHLKLSAMKATTAVAIVSTSAGFLIASGVIMTDMLLSLSMIMVMTGFWRGWHGEPQYNYFMYFGLAIGLLAKGPLIIILAGFAIFPWLVINNGYLNLWEQIWKRSNILSGLALVLLISGPWYLLAEKATPGFLEYFFIGEHFQRFIDSGWQGDLYGSGHARSRGTIWLYWFLVALPWSPLLMLIAYRKFLLRKKVDHSVNGLTSFLFCWMLSPLILFTSAANILPAYVLPGLPAIGLLIAPNFHFTHQKRNDLLFLAGPLLLVIIAARLIFWTDENGYKFSEKTLLNSDIDSSLPLYYYKTRPYSAQYYSNGKAKITDTTQPGDNMFYLVIKKRQINDSIKNNCFAKASNKKRILYFCQK